MQATVLSHSWVSHHLGALRQSGLVEDERDAQWVIYRIARHPTGSAEGQLLQLVSRWGEDDAEVAEDRRRLARASREQVSGGART